MCVCLCVRENVFRVVANKPTLKSIYGMQLIILCLLHMYKPFSICSDARVFAAFHFAMFR